MNFSLCLSFFSFFIQAAIGIFQSRYLVLRPIRVSRKRAGVTSPGGANSLSFPFYTRNNSIAMAKDALRVSDVMLRCRALLMVRAFFLTDIPTAASTATSSFKVCLAQDLAAAISTYDYKLNTEELEATALVSGDGPRCAKWLECYHTYFFRLEQAQY